jgi:hypothetical protein
MKTFPNTAGLTSKLLGTAAAMLRVETGCDMADAKRQPLLVLISDGMDRL